MMFFWHINIETPLELSNEEVLVLILENATDFYSKVNDFIGIFNGQENGLSFWDESKPVHPEKVGELIPNIFSFEFNNKKVLNLLFKRIEEDFFNGQSIISLGEINSKIICLLNGLTLDFPFATTFDELSIQTLLKASNVALEEEYDTLLEKIICYLNVLAELKNLKFFVFVNIKSVLEDEDLEKLYYHCQKEKISLLLIESVKIRPLLPQEKAIIITKDLCEILENFQ